MATMAQVFEFPPKIEELKKTQPDAAKEAIELLRELGAMARTHDGYSPFIESTHYRPLSVATQEVFDVIKRMVH